MLTITSKDIVTSLVKIREVHKRTACMLRIHVKIMVDGLFIRSLLCSFFFKIFPEIILEGRLFIAEPPLYRVDDKKNPFVINKEDYNNRYIQKVLKEYRIGGYEIGTIGPLPPIDDREPVFFGKKELKYFLESTTSYVDDITMLAKHYLVNDRLIELIIEELAYTGYNKDEEIQKLIDRVDIQHLMSRVGVEFPELYYDDKDKIIKGVIDGKYQSLEISERLVRKSIHLIINVEESGPSIGEPLVLKNIKTNTEQKLSLLGVLKILKKFQPNILHRFKGLGENNDEDIKQTIMDPNTRCLIRLQITDIENDLATFQMLRGSSPFDARNRKLHMKSYKIPKDLIDT